MSNPVLIMLVGIPGSGKSYFANNLAQQDGCVIHSSDALREELFGAVDHQTDNRELFRVLENRIIDDLRAGKTVIYDATNISRRRRAAFVARAKKRSGCVAVCTFLDMPLDLCIERNNERERNVPTEVVERMFYWLEPPSADEGWDDINHIRWYTEVEVCAGG